MKNLTCLFCVCALTCAFFAACNWNGEPKTKAEEEPKLTETQDVKICDELTAFFDKNVNRIAQSIFHKDGMSRLIDTCVMINRIDELPKADQGGTPFEFQFPDIDFDANTLVIGQWVGGGGLYLMSQNLIVEQNVATISLTIGQSGGIHAADVRHMSFWKLYPKLTSKSIHTNVIYDQL